MESRFKLILISPEQDVKNELITLCRLFNFGLHAYHLRKPYWSVEEMGGFLATVPNEFINKIVLHSHFELANKYNVNGIHLNENNKIYIAQYTGLKLVSASFHSINEIKENVYGYRYVFLSPIFDSISKEGYRAKFDLNLLAEELAELKHGQVPVNVIALGGIDAENIMRVKNAGFAGVALLGSIWQNEDPVSQFLKVQELVKR